MGLSARAIAPKLGVSHTAVNKAAARGRIPREPDGTFDLEKVRPAWDANVDIHQQKRGNAKPQEFSGTRHPRVDGADSEHTPIGESPSIPPSEGTLAWVELERAKIKLEVERMQFDEQKGKLIQADQIERQIEERAATEKQALLNWPSRVSPTIAAELGVDERLVRKALDDHICEFLTERSRVPTDD